MTITISRKVLIPVFALIIGYTFGMSGTLTSSAEGVIPGAQSEIIKVCINLKTGAIRASSKCDSKTERKTVLGGTGAKGAQGEKGDKGDVGEQGVIGLQGAPGIKGADGKSADFKIKTISFLASSTCAGVLDGFELPVVNRIDEYITTRTYARHYTGTLRGCSVTVYVP
jgi:hypothetical protein